MIAAAAEPGPAVLVEPLRPGRASGLLVGRGNEVDQLLELLTPAPDPAVVRPDAGRGAVVVSAVAGMGGIGKTALAVHTALLAAGRGWFPGGVLLLDLRGYAPGQAPVRSEQVYASLLRELGVPAERIPGTPVEQAGLYHRVLDQLATAGARVLLVLDNAADSTQVQDLLPRQLAHRALITTRDLLGLPDARRIFLDVLSVAGAADLLIRLLRADNLQDPRPDTEPTAVARLVELCGRLPLAVRIVAAILTDEPALTVTALADQLADAETRLHGMAYGGGDVAAVIDFSYRRLAAHAPEATELLTLLTVNPGPDLSTETAAAIADIPTAVAATRLRALRAASLLQHTPSGRWQLHDLLALYTRRHLALSAADQAISRLLSYYCAAADAADDHLRGLPGQPIQDRFAGRQEALAWFDVEHTNLTAAVAHAHQTGYLDHTTRLAASLKRYLRWRWHLNDWVTVATHASSAAATFPDPQRRAIASNNLGLALRATRRFDEAITAHQLAIGIYRDVGDQHGEGQAWNNLGLALQEVRRFDEAIAAHQEAGNISRKVGDRRGEGQAWINLGNALREVRRFDEAVSADQQAIDICREVGDRRGEGQAWTNLGKALREVRRFDEAVSADQQAIDIYREVGDRRGEGQAWTNLGNALGEVQQFDEAVSADQQAIDIYRELGDRHGEGQAWNNLGVALWEVRRFDEAVSADQQAIDIYRELGDRHGEGQAWNNLGIALREVRRFDEAITAHQHAGKIHREVGDRRGEGRAWNNLGIALREVQRFDEAITAHQNDLSICRELGDRYGEGQAWFNLGSALRGVRRFDEAVSAWGEAAAAFEDAGDQKAAALLRRLHGEGRP
ncbi:tetratricopeptide repeat protein [Amycolatopsis sp. cmx-4-61]|uniref:tetratricopeptide repeat protein n=1 Tax=Amycolatopsis sp. cmx-4-61 TaxID=2790937 RepID=UPI0039798A0B